MPAGGPSQPAAPVAAGTLETMLAEAVRLAERTRDIIGPGRPAGAARRDPLAELERAAELGHVTTLVTACVAWLLARLAAAHGEIDAEEARAEPWRLLPLDALAGPGTACRDPELAALARACDGLYARIRRLDAALDSPPRPGH